MGSMEPQPERPVVDVAILGGGFAGFSTAIGLQNHPHLNVNVYEAANEFYEVGTGIVMGPNAQAAMDVIDPRMRQGYECHAVFSPSKPNENGLYTWFTLHKGEQPDLEEVVTSYKHPTRPSTVHRAEFLEELVKLVDSDKVHFGMRAKAIHESDDPDGKIAIHFKNGSIAWADIVIGADGVHSLVRKHILGADHPAAQSQYTGTTIFRATVSAEDLYKKMGNDVPRRALCGTNGHIVHFPVSQGKKHFLGVTCHNTAERKTVTAQDLEEAKSKFSTWGDVAQKLVELLPEGQTDAWAVHDMPPAPTYFKGRVAMTGDAAHATSPHLGSGASSAIEDGMVLGMLLGKYLEPAERGHLPLSVIAPLLFQAYDTVRKFRSQKIVYMSRRTGKIMSGLLPGVEGTVGEMRKAMKPPLWIWNQDQQEQVQDAVEVFEAARRGTIATTFDLKSLSIVE